MPYKANATNRTEHVNSKKSQRMENKKNIENEMEKKIKMAYTHSALLHKNLPAVYSVLCPYTDTPRPLQTVISSFVSHFTFAATRSEVECDAAMD